MANDPVKILTVDDNPDNLTILKALILEAFPYAVVLSALNGPRALELAVQHEPDMILLDIIMPGMDGYEVCRRLKSDELLCEIPIVFITAIKSNKESRINALDCGAEAFLTKPIDESELTAQIRAMLKIRKAVLAKRTETERLAFLVQEKTAELTRAHHQTLALLDEIKAENAIRVKSEGALRESEERYKYLFDHSGVGIGYYTPEGIVISFNKRALAGLGGVLSDYVGKSIYALFPAQEAATFAQRITNAISCDFAQAYEDCILLHGTQKWLSTIYMRVANASGQLIGVQVASHDITDRKHAEAEAQEHAIKFHSLFDEMSSGAAIYKVYNDGANAEDYIVQDFNKAALRAEGKDKSAVLGKSLHEIRPNIDQFGLIPILQNVWQTGEPRNYPSHIYVDERFSNWYENRIYKLPSGEIVALFDDVTEKKRADEEIQHLAFHDHLTDVYNRRYFETNFSRLNSASNYPLAIIAGDINGLKLINDSLGHSAGDSVIQQFALEIQKQIGGNDSLARIGGDEFGVILTKMTETDVKQLSDHLQSSIRLRIANRADGDTGIELTATFGYSVQNYLGQALDLLMKESESYMYRRKFYDNASKHGHVIDAIMNALFEKSEREQQHSLRVSHISAAIAEAMSLDAPTVAKVKVAGSLHDIGKIGIDESILNKPGRLNEQEYEVMKQHPLRSARILASIDEYLDIVPIVKAHHEWMDGTGYPAGLDKSQIPLEARIISVADAFDAMTICRPYRDPISKSTAAQELQRCVGSQFDPVVVEAFIRLVLPGMD